jgi:hypothetical protein
MRIVVITPVGPGHEEYARDCRESVRIEEDRARIKVKHLLIDDTGGKLGRSKARNIGMEEPADWYFFLDADDRMAKGALEAIDKRSPATFGLVAKINKEYAFNVMPCGWREVALYGCAGTLSMGFFLRADHKMPFNEDMDAGEDFEFYMRLPSFVKVDKPLALIGYNRPSATGPRGYERLDWTEVCNQQIVKAVKANPGKYDLGCHAVLAKKRSTRKNPQPVQETL